MGGKVGIVIQTRPAEAPAVPAKTTRDVLLHAALLIEEFGWQQGHYESADGRLCLWGAIRVSQTGTPYGNADACGKENDALAKVLGTFATIHWNDEPGRSAAEVVAALRAAADAS